MAQKKIIQYFDDLDGTHLDEGSVHETLFSINGQDYVIDLSEDNAKKFVELFQPYIDAGRKATGATARRRRRSTSPGRDHIRKVRAWAKQQPGIEIADRGKISDAILTAYAEANSM